MSDKTELDGLAVVDLVELTRGFEYLFWGLLVFLMALTETLARPVLSLFPALFLGAGGIGAVIGVYRLYRVRGLGAGWRNQTRHLLLVTGLVAYLSLFYVFWRAVPGNVYFLLHVVGLFGCVIALLSLVCPPVMQLARAAQRRKLFLESMIFANGAIVLLVPAWALISQQLVTAVRHDQDPFFMLQLWFEQTSLWSALLILTPVALVLSLVWSAKGLTRGALLAKQPPAS